MPAIDLHSVGIVSKYLASPTALMTHVNHGFPLSLQLKCRTSLPSGHDRFIEFLPNSSVSPLVDAAVMNISDGTISLQAGLLASVRLIQVAKRFAVLFTHGSEVR